MARQGRGGRGVHPFCLGQQLTGQRQRLGVAAEPGQHERAGSQARYLDHRQAAGCRDGGVRRPQRPGEVASRAERGTRPRSRSRRPYPTGGPAARPPRRARPPPRRRRSGPAGSATSSRRRRSPPRLRHPDRAPAWPPRPAVRWYSSGHRPPTHPRPRRAGSPPAAAVAGRQAAARRPADMRRSTPGIADYRPEHPSAAAPGHRLPFVGELLKGRLPLALEVGVLAQPAERLGQLQPEVRRLRVAAHRLGPEPGRLRHRAQRPGVPGRPPPARSG